MPSTGFRHPALRWAAAVLVLGAAPLAAQSVPSTRKLTRPDAELGEPFDQVIALRELGAGKVLVTDGGARSVVLADFASGRQTPVGRNGQGPGEYQFPGELLPAGDTTFIVDRASRRLLAVAPDGRMTGRTVPFPEAIGGLPAARGADRSGRIYFQASPFRVPDEGGEVEPKLPDSTAVLRWDRAANRVDTVAKVKIPATRVNVSGDQRARMVMMRPQPYAPEDDWAVAADGRVAIARVSDYHIEWVDDGRRIAGAPVPYPRRRVTEADRTRYLAELRSNRNRVVVTRGPTGGRAPEVRIPEPGAEDFVWPEYLPPFRRGMLISPEGQAWVPRHDEAPVYDVFDSRGNLAARLELPPGRRLVGLGRGVLYAIRTDSDGLQWLERYPR
ncbi:MAG TPA: hypothetical protein VNJ71_02590 [Gemmatimonadales bacterium]|nr:hypothetical protein [Gemmatimonadales bacterium]